MRSFQRTHGNEIHLNVLSLGSRFKLLDCRFKPLLLLRSVGDPDFDALAIAGEDVTGTQRGRENMAPLSQPIGAGDATGDEQGNDCFA